MLEHKKEDKAKLLSTELLQKKYQLSSADDPFAPDRFSFLEYGKEQGSLTCCSGMLANRIFSDVPETYSRFVQACIALADEDWNCKKVKEGFDEIKRAKELGKDAFCSFILFGKPDQDNEKWIFVNIAYKAADEKTSIFISDAAGEGKRIRGILEKSLYDPLTQAWNRSAMEEIVNEKAAAGETRPFVMADLDGFKALNDSMGHMAGDDILISVVKKLKEGLPEGAQIGRIGGDEFFIMLPVCENTQKAAEMTAAINPLCRMNLPGGLRISASLGVAVSPEDGTDFRTLYGKADIAMYAAKRRGGDNYLFYDSEMENIGTRVSNEKFESKRDALESVGDYTCLCDREGHVIRYTMLQTAGEESKKGKVLWEDIVACGVCDEASGQRIQKSFSMLEKDRSISGEYKMKDAAGEEEWFRLSFVCTEEDHVFVSFTDISSQVAHEEYATGLRDYDELTGLFIRRAFCKAVNSAMKRDQEGVNNGRYAMVSFNIARFKVINDMFGSEGGDRLLAMMGKNLREIAGKKGFGCRNGADRIYLFVQCDEKRAEDYAKQILDRLADFARPYT
ncbi:MAG: hypothetical protein CW338_11085, partial [Clostridiales bacterium]|nr:hypothetical protein [Clostridiales bacterium]